jgi:4-diphosphocytidyl-2-C-methyl-D-erythritol kinase
VNLQLAVGPLRADGYHELVTVFHAVSLFDEVTVRPADRTSVRVSGADAAAVPSGRANLAVRAAAALARVARPRGASSAVAIEIRKRIPVAAGLAGGSADAAAALVACNELWQAGLSAAELSAVAAGVGSDVAFALLGGTAVGRGRGEQVTVALAAGTYHWVLAFSSGGLSTPEVYAACDRLRAARAARAAGPAAGPGRVRAAGPRAALTASPVAGAAGGHGVSPVASSAGGRGMERVAGTAAGEGAADAPAPRLSTELMAALRSADPAAVGPLLTNDLEPAALSLRPALRRTLSAGRELGAIGAMVSGSGPTCAFLAADARHARDLAVSLTGAGVCRGVAGVHGPVHGATVIPAAEHG